MEMVAPETLTEYNQLGFQIIGAAMAVQDEFGFGLLEEIYREALIMELRQRNIRVKSEQQINVHYKGLPIGKHFRLDLLVEDAIIVELKAVESLHPRHFSQLNTYLKTADKKLGYLINFHISPLKNGIHRLINGYF
jgi:GxxExxY protein